MSDVKGVTHIDQPSPDRHRTRSTEFLWVFWVSKGTKGTSFDSEEIIE